jgi:hypothetical protein
MTTQTGFLFSSFRLAALSCRCSRAGLPPNSTRSDICCHGVQSSATVCLWLSHLCLLTPRRGSFLRCRASDRCTSVHRRIPRVCQQGRQGEKRQVRRGRGRWRRGLRCARQGRPAAQLGHWWQRVRREGSAEEDRGTTRASEGRTRYASRPLHFPVDSIVSAF